MQTLPPDARERILAIMNRLGPVLPFQIARELHTDIIMASAALSELAAHGKVKISTMKVGGSPLYYTSGHEAGLMKYSGNLNEKEQRALTLLTEKKVLVDKSETPLTRVALREMKDFAVPLKVTQAGSEFLFWKFYLVSNEQATKIIDEILNPSVKKTEPAFHASEQQLPPAEQKTPSLAAYRTQQTEMPLLPKEIQTQISSEPSDEKKGLRKKTAAEQPLIPASQETTSSQIPDDKFYKTATDFFTKNNMTLYSFLIIKKNTEIDFIIDIPSPVGNLRYFCKAKNKKKINDADISSAFMAGTLKRLPVIVLTDGELTKKAQEMVAGELKGITVARMR